MVFLHNHVVHNWLIINISSLIFFFNILRTSQKKTYVIYLFTWVLTFGEIIWINVFWCQLIILCTFVDSWGRAIIEVHCVMHVFWVIFPLIIINIDLYPLIFIGFHSQTPLTLIVYHLVPLYHLLILDSWPPLPNKNINPRQIVFLYLFP